MDPIFKKNPQNYVVKTIRFIAAWEKKIHLHHSCSVQSHILIEFYKDFMIFRDEIIDGHTLDLCIQMMREAHPKIGDLACSMHSLESLDNMHDDLPQDANPV